MNTIKIFLASSAELKDDRKEFAIFIGQENNILIPKGVRLELELWEDFIDAMSARGLQDGYNKTVQQCDIFIMLFCTKVGKYTAIEFEKAFQQFKKTNTPLIYTYFKNSDKKLGDVDQKDMNTLWKFQAKVRKLKHFQTNYENIDTLTSHFRHQLDKLFAAGYFKFAIAEKHTESSFQQISKCLSAGEPSIPPGFIGRDAELIDIKEKLEKYGLLLIHAEGGMGKTTIAAKYLKDNIDKYKYYAWLFCDNGVTEQIKRLALPLKIDLTQYATEEEQLLVIKTALQNLSKDCLLILDNANDPKHLNDFQKYFGGLNCHLLLTSRCQQVLPGENEYIINHLSHEQAKTLFKTYHDEQTVEFENLLDRFLNAIGFNTLMIELFSKNLHELSALGETLADALEQFSQKGLFLGEKSFEIRAAWTGNVHKEAANTDQILETLYDLTKLDEIERNLLVNFALLPAESHLLDLLKEILTPEDKFSFAKQLKALAQKGWLNTDTKSYRMSPVVQQIVIAKNKDSVEEDARLLISKLNEKLEHSNGSLANLLNYAQARPFAEIAESVAGFLTGNSFEIGLLVLYLSDYYKAIGNLKFSLKQLIRAAEIFRKVGQENYAACLDRLGGIYQEQGEFKKSLDYFELDLQLTKELFELNPHSESLKNGLAISYEKLGSIYQQQGEFKKALEYFELETDLFKELFASNPHSESLKNGLAISYEKLGSIYQQQGEFKKALDYFELRSQLGKELFESNLHSESLESGLAISYEKLGSIYQQQGEFKKALDYFELYLQLSKELFASNPHSESLKNGLAISYEKLGSIYQQQGEFKKALDYFELDLQLTKELFESNPHSVSLYNGLAVSYINLGSLYKEMKEVEKVKQYLQKAEAIWLHLTELVPMAVEFQNNLRWVKGQLEDL